MVCVKGLKCLMDFPSTWHSCVEARRGMVVCVKGLKCLMDFPSTLHSCVGARRGMVVCVEVSLGD